MSDFLDVAWALRWPLLFAFVLLGLAIGVEQHVTRGSDYYHPDLYDRTEETR